MRRRFGSPFRRQGPPVEAIPPALRHAHELMQMGDYPRAALSFEQLAHAAEARQGPRAPFLFFQAGQARISQGQVGPGVAHFKHGLELLKQTGRFNQFYRAGQQLAQELKLRGLENEARELSALLSGGLPAIAEMPTERGPELNTPRLLTHCPACGGPLRAPEVEWLEAGTAECPYCGSPVHAE